MKIKPISAKDFRKLLKVSALNLSQEQDLAPSVIHFMERTDLYRSSLKAVAAYGNGLHLPPVILPE